MNRSTSYHLSVNVCLLGIAVFAAIGVKPLSAQNFSHFGISNMRGLEFSITSDNTTMKLSSVGGPLRITSISPIGDKSGEAIGSKSRYPTLWRLILCGPDDAPESIVADTVPPTHNIIKKKVDGRMTQELILTWPSLAIGTQGHVSVTVRIEVTEGEPLISMRISVDNQTKYRLQRVDFPFISGVGPFSNTASQDKLVWPRTCGKLISNPYAKGIPNVSWERCPYPSAVQSMQFVGLYGERGGLYFAAYDPAAYKKMFWYTPAENKQSMDLLLQNYPDKINIPGNDYQMPYPVVLTTSKGDWWDLAAIYREWALDQPWCRQINVLQDETISSDVKNAAMWPILRNNPNDVLRQGLKLKEVFQVPFILEYSEWTQAPYDHYYPEYFPPQKGFQETVQELQSAGIPVMPYLNARIWDKQNDSFYKKKIYDETVWDELNRDVVEVYHRQPFAVMHPSSKLWQKTMSDVCDIMVNTYGVQGLYLDQISALGPTVPNNNPKFSVGGGNDWAGGYWEMLDEIKKCYPGKPIFRTSESFTECYILRLEGGFLTWAWHGDDAIPVAQAVYGGRTSFWGRWIGQSEHSDENFYSKVADMLAKGVIIGWIDRWILDESAASQREYAVRLVRMYDSVLRKAFLDGYMIRPPATNATIPTIKAKWPQEVNCPAVMRAAWRCRDGETLLLMINVTDSVQTVSTKWNSFPAATNVETRRIWTTQNTQWKTLAKLPESLEIQSRQAVVISLIPGGLQQADLQKRSPKIPSKPVNVILKGFPGHDSSQLLSLLNKSVLPEKPDLVVLMVGTNDALNPGSRCFTHFDENLILLCNNIRQVGSDVILCTIPPFDSSAVLRRHPASTYEPLGPQKRVDKINQQIRSIASRLNIPCVDINKRFDELDCWKNNLIRTRENSLGDDGVHPTAAGHKAIAAEVYKVIKQQPGSYKTVLCLGDSITFGSHMTGSGKITGETYPGYLNTMLNQSSGKCAE